MKIAYRIQLLLAAIGAIILVVSMISQAQVLFGATGFLGASEYRVAAIGGTFVFVSLGVFVYRWIHIKRRQRSIPNRSKQNDTFDNPPNGGG